MMIDEFRKNNNRFTGARVLVSRFAFSLSKKIEIILDNVYGERFYNTTKGRRPTIDDSRFTIHHQRIMEGETDCSPRDSKMTIADK